MEFQQAFIMSVAIVSVFIVIVGVIVAKVQSKDDVVKFK